MYARPLKQPGASYPRSSAPGSILYGMLRDMHQLMRKIRLTLIVPVLPFLLSLPATAFANFHGGGGAPNPSGGSGSGSIENPLRSDITSFAEFIKVLLRAVVEIGIPIAVFFIVYAGFKFVLAQGKEEELRKARENFMWTIIGVAIFLGAWLLATIIEATIEQIT